MGSVHARGDTFLTFGLKALTETNTSRLTTDMGYISRHKENERFRTYNFSNLSNFIHVWYIRQSNQVTP
jgi:hypothetical protein